MREVRFEDQRKSATLLSSNAMRHDFTYKRKIDGLSCNHCCSGKTISIAYSELCVCSLSYPACKAHEPYYIVTYSLSGSTIFVHIILQRHDFRGGKQVLEHMCEFCISLQICLGHV